MNLPSLAQSYLEKSQKRLRVLPVLMEEDAFSDVVREAQEIVELALKGILRTMGIDPPKQHDVGYLLLEYKERLPEQVRPEAEKLAAISKWLRKEREFSFCGDIDFIPTLEYTSEDGSRASRDAHYVVSIAGLVIPPFIRL
ncbi:MAG TPA: HEPN domain-containing protein [Atribacteraceae bacterium]|nr:HEPN domain-containing protein [Atribacteraceae bacterium]